MFVLAPVSFNGASAAPSGAGPSMNGGYRGPAGAGLPEDVQPSRNPVAMMGEYKPVFDRWPCESADVAAVPAVPAESGFSFTKLLLGAIGGLALGAMLKDMNGGKPVA